jgi:hypothetical protein
VAQRYATQARAYEGRNSETFTNRFSSYACPRWWSDKPGCMRRFLYLLYRQGLGTSNQCRALGAGSQNVTTVACLPRLSFRYVVFFLILALHSIGCVVSPLPAVSSLKVRSSSIASTQTPQQRSPNHLLSAFHLPVPPYNYHLSSLFSRRPLSRILSTSTSSAEGRRIISTNITNSSNSTSSITSTGTGTSTTASIMRSSVIH